MEDLRPGCVVLLNDGRKGICRYAGKTHFIDGDWVGVELEEPTGKNDGLVAGERYFECEQDYGLFVKRAAVAQVLERPPKPQQSTSRARAQTGATAGEAGTRRPAPVGAHSRHSVSTASPSPASRASSQQRAGLRSPIKSPTKQLTGSTANRSSISDTSRTPAAGAAGAGAKPRPRTSTTTGTKAPMGPPSAPVTRRPSRPSLSGPTKQPSRQSLQGAAAASTGPKRPSSRQVASKDINTETESGMSDAVNETDSPDAETEDQDNESPTSRGPPQPPTSRVNTARQRLSQPMAQRPALASTSNKDVDEMKTKVKVMEKKRAEDREKLQTLERLQAERDKFEGIIQKLQTKYQPQQAEIGELRKKLKDAQARVDEIEGVLAEHDSAMEMATLDREMAEETAEAYKTETEALKLKLEELQLELDVLRDENEEFGQGTSPEDRSNQNWLQTEKHNERLREALVRLRDMTQQQEADLKAHIKELEQDLEEYAEIKSQFEKTKEKLLASEENVEALKQQLDTALGAEEMIEELSDKNMRYQEEINELKAAIEDLEALKEISDELESTHVETEKQLQEEIDYREGLFNEQCRRITQQDEVVDDLEYTLVKFRELVSTLQGDLEDMRASQQISEAEANDLTTRSRAMIDLNMKLQASAAKTQTKTIEVELGQLEAQEAIRHLSIAKLYLPEYYETERNSVLALLRFERVSFKASLMNNTIREKTSNQSSAAMSPEDFFIAHDVLEKLLCISSVCDLLVSYISSCSSETFTEIKGTLFEMEPVERTLNFWIELLKKDEVNMGKCATELQRSIALLSHLAETMLPSTPEIFSWELCMWTSQTQSYLDHSASCISRLRSLMQPKITEPEEGNEEIPLFFNKMDGLSSQARGLKVAMGKVYRAVSDFQSRSLALPSDKGEPFQKTEEAAKEVSTLSRQFAESIMELLSDEGRTEPLTLKEALDSLSQASASHAQASESESEGSDALSLFGSKLRAISNSLEELDSISSNLSLTTEFERRPSPWIARAEELRSNKTISPDADEEIRHVKAEIQEASTALGVKDKTIEEQAIKIELVESRMREASKKASMVKGLEAKIEQAQAQEADLLANLERQRKDLEAMETERNELKSRMDRVKRASGTAGVTTTADGVVVDSGVSLATMYENETLRAEVQSLQAAVRFLREENRRMQMLDPYSVQRAADLHSWLDVPLTKPSARTTSAPSPTGTTTATTTTTVTTTTEDNTTKAQQTATESKDAFMHLLKLTKDAKVCDLQSTLSQDHQGDGSGTKSRGTWRPSKTKLRYQVLHQREDFSRWTEWRDDIVAYEREQDRLAVAKKERAAASVAAAAARKARHVATGSVQEFPQGMGHGMMGRAWRIMGLQSQKHGGQGMMGDDAKEVGAGAAGDGFVEPSIMPDS